MNGWYDRILGAPVQQQPQNSGMIFQNPLQKVNYIMQAMTNPAQFVKQQFPDIPDDISHNPNQVLQYLQRTRGISNDQLNQIVNQFGRR